MFVFVSYKTDDDKERIEQFFSWESYWEWLGEWRGQHGGYPKSMCVFTATCVFDGS